MSRKLTEASMGKAVCQMNMFKGLGVRFLAEVPYGAKRIDLAGLSTDSQIFAIELKVDKWRRAMWQASIYQLCADFAYIAIRKEYAHRVDMDYLDGLGIGLIAVSDGKANLRLKARPSPIVSQAERQPLVNLLMAGLSQEGCGDVDFL